MSEECKSILGNASLSGITVVSFYDPGNVSMPINLT